MAKKLSKRQQRALRKANADGKITGKERKSLKASGISSRQIERTKSRSKPTNNKQRNRLLNAANADGKITNKEKQRLKASGLSDMQILKVSNPEAYKKQRGAEIREKKGIKTKAEVADIRKTQPYTSKDKKHASRVLSDLLGITNTKGDYIGKPGNYGSDRPRQSLNVYSRATKGTNAKSWEHILGNLGIKSFDSANDVREVFAYVQGGAGGGSGGGSGRKQTTGAPRDTGKYKDILNAQDEDRRAGEEMAKELADLKAKLGGISPEVQEQLDSLTLANTGLTNDLINQSEANKQALAEQGAANAQALADKDAEWSGKLDSLSASYEDKLTAAASASSSAIGRLEDMMLQQQLSALQTQQLLTSQLQSTQSALANQQRLSTNLANAYVPQAEVSAQSVIYGDTRQQKRKTQNNSLSDLSIVSGVTSSNSTSGLQVAG